MPKSIQDQIQDLENTRAAKVARNEKLMAKSSDEGRSMDEAEKEEFERNADDIDELDEELVRARRLEKQLGTAKPIRKGADTDPSKANKARDIRIEPGERTVPKGVAFARYVGALCRSRFNLLEAAEYAKRWNDSTPEVSTILKAAVTAGTTTDSDWASKLVEYQTITSEWLELLRPMTILGKFGANGIPALRSMPFNTRMVVQTGGGVYSWVGEGARKPVGELVVDEVTMRWAKTSGIIVVTDELMRFSAPNSDLIVRDDLLRGTAQFLDSQFVDPAVGPASNTAPASITYNIGATNASGTTPAHLRADLETLWAPFWAAHLPMASGVFLMSNRMAQRLSLARTALGVREFPDLTPLGGSLEGYPVITSEAVPTASSGDMIIFLLANQIFLADDGQITVDASREATIQLASDPEGADTSGTPTVSLWQRNLIALRAERYIRWQAARSDVPVVGVIDEANYSGAQPES